MDRKKSQRDLVRPPIIRTPPRLPTGPALTRERKDKGYKSPTDEPPEGFLGGQNSRYEWMIYHALSKVMGVPEDPRQPPFLGAPGVWTYQKAWDDGRKAIGGSVIDFVVYAGGKASNSFAFRIQTEYHHLATDHETHAFDLMQQDRLSQFFRVVDLYDSDFAFDRTNQAAIVLIKDALAGKTFPNPITNGTTERVSRISHVSV